MLDQLRNQDKGDDTSVEGKALNSLKPRQKEEGIMMNPLLKLRKHSSNTLEFHVSNYLLNASKIVNWQGQRMFFFLALKPQNKLIT